METANENGNKNEEETRETKREIPANLQKICLVCGDKALGYNFNAISCESCKAFFRRNALASKEFKCPFTNNCKITAVTRRFCQKCRLEKCFSIGMVKEFIMSEQDKAEKRRKIEENKAKKRQNLEPDDYVSSSKAAKRDEHPSYYTQDQSIIQYDVLNSTTCSPSSSMVQSPLSEVDTSIQSPSAYPVYAPVQVSEYPYAMKVYPIDEKTVITKEVYDQRILQPLEPYSSVCDSISSSIFDPPKQNSIRSILTQDTEATTFKDIRPVVENQEPEHVCAELPSTSSANPDVNKAKLILQDVERIEPNSMESILCEAIKLEFESYSPVANCSGSSRGLNEVERAKLNELIVANKAHHAPIDDDVSQLIGDAATFKDGDGKHDPRLIMVVNLTAVAIRRFIKMAKKIGAFRNMCEEDQVALLKGGVIELMILRSTMNYDGQKNQWKLPHSQENGPFGSIRTDLLKLAKGNIYRSHEDFINSFDPRWRTDENVILIMSAILLFTPDRPKVVHKDVVKLEQNSYYYLLRRYLESVYPGCEAKSTFLKLIQKILELRKLTEEVTSVYLDVNPLEPLLMEIFDLKHHAA